MVSVGSIGLCLEFERNSYYVDGIQIVHSEQAACSVIRIIARMEIVKTNSISSVCCTRCSVWYDNTAVPDEEYSGSIRLPRHGGLLSIELSHTFIRRRCLKVSTAFCCHNSNMSSRVICFKQDARCRNHLGKMYSTTEMSFLFQSARFCFSQLTEIKLNMSKAMTVHIGREKTSKMCTAVFDKIFICDNFW